jgi:prepilin-type N-terminal cleavage/methylation domain-containing protein
MARQSNRRGVTLTEMMVAIAIMGLTFGLAKMGVDWMVALGRQRILLNAQWTGQVTLYEITRNIRNCSQIVNISSGSLTLAVFRPADTGGWSDPAFVVTRATGTLVYSYVQADGETFLQRSYTFPDPTFAGPEANAPLITRSTKLLVNMLEPPVGSMYMFAPYLSADQNVEVVIRIRPTYWSAEKYGKPIEYRTISMKRTSTLT